MVLRAVSNAVHSGVRAAVLADKIASSSTPTPFVRDTFTDPDGTYLLTGSHVGEIGASYWDVEWGTGLSQILNDGTNSGVAGFGNAAISSPPGVPATANYKIDAPFLVKSLISGCNVGIVVRSLADNGYVIVYNEAITKWQLYKLLAGVLTLLDEYAQVLTPGSYKGTLEAIGTAIKFYVDDVLRISVTNSDISVKGKPAVWTNTNGGTIPTSTTGVWLDKFEAFNI